MSIRPFGLLIVCLSWLIGGVGCANRGQTTTTPTAAESPAPPKILQAATKPRPARPTHSFAVPPPNHDPLFGTTDPRYGSDRLKFQALCCPEHDPAARPETFDPLID